MLNDVVDSHFLTVFLRCIIFNLNKIPELTCLSMQPLTGQA